MAHMCVWHARLAVYVSLTSCPSSSTQLVLSTGAAPLVSVQSSSAAAAEPLLEAEGPLRVSLEVPWPPELEKDESGGFVCLSRPPLFPRMVRVVLGEALRVHLTPDHLHELAVIGTR